MKKLAATLGVVGFVTVGPVVAAPFFFSTGNPDGLMGTLSRRPGPGRVETETADDFILSNQTLINHATFVGLLPTGTLLSSVSDVEIEFYHVFPADSANPPSGNVPTRVNSPGDVEIGAATRDSGTLSVTTTLLNASFTVLNTVVNGIHPIPNQFTGGEGPATGEEVLFDVSFSTPIDLQAGQYFFRPEVGLTSGNFLWLSAPKPITGGTGPFAADLQSWIRNDGPGSLAPDWLRIGTDITHQGPFNATFSLSGTTLSGTTPEPGTLALVGLALAGLATLRRRTQN